MHQLTPAGQQMVNNLSARHGVSTDAVTHMLFSVLNGQGTMAQFSHPELGGSGQWMRGGMTMVGDMFNNGLKYRVDALCSDISNLLNEQPGLFQGGSFQSQSQSSGGMSSGTGMPIGESSLFVPDPRSQWYPAELGSPNSSGSQNNVRYAYFGNARRLAVDTGGEVWVYDTLDHQIGGFSQQQGSGGSITFTSQYGTVNLSSLPLVSRNGQPVAAQQDTYSNNSTSMSSTSGNSYAPSPAPAQYAPAGAAQGGDTNAILAALEKLGDLKAKGILSDSEFSAKKADLLSRL
ncbi:MAG: hypothetical protein CVU28_00580 [Betaproteobacteria bacterium HGW-Betaproteobacteria-21]|nr:MAG: hypothetical protein CVU28_00580 [Betaproteobacteria bacterium HGW-Betaproteobacteria-21]